MPTVLTPDQQKSYYATQGNAAKPLSPEEYVKSLKPADRPAGELPPLSSDGTGTAGATTQSLGDMGNLRLALRSALTEASQTKAGQRIQAMSGLTSGGASPNVIQAALGLAQKGLAGTTESIVSDVTRTFQEQQKLAEFNPEQFRSVQGGIYDIKNNDWVINPKTSTGGGTSNKTLTRTDTEKLGLPVTLTGTSWSMFSEQVQSSVPPPWFREIAEQNLKKNPTMSMLPGKTQTLDNNELNRLWEQFRGAFTGSFEPVSSGASGGGLDYNDF